MKKDCHKYFVIVLFFYIIYLAFPPIAWKILFSACIISNLAFNKFNSESFSFTRASNQLLNSTFPLSYLFLCSNLLSVFLWMKYQKFIICYVRLLNIYKSFKIKKNKMSSYNRRIYAIILLIVRGYFIDFILYTYLTVKVIK